MFTSATSKPPPLTVEQQLAALTAYVAAIGNGARHIVNTIITFVVSQTGHLSAANGTRESSFASEPEGEPFNTNMEDVGDA
jgi:hypothetical protein